MYQSSPLLHVTNKFTQKFISSQYSLYINIINIMFMLNIIMFILNIILLYVKLSLLFILHIMYWELYESVFHFRLL